MTGPQRAADGEGWREKAVERSLRSARERAVSRSERFIEVATELLYETGSLEFTVQELVERSRMSLRSFYQHFASKDDLLLAVLEEAIRGFVASLRAEIDAEDDPLEQLRIYVTSFYGAGQRSDQQASAALSRYLLMLTSDEPSELARVLAPQVALLSQIIEAGVAAGRFRQDVSSSSLTILVTQTLTSAVEMNVLGTQLTGEPISTADLWNFCRAAVEAPRRGP
ncbi:MAG TPA: TetR/AcrR family transcriptional regulator [Acidimicrobiales bacterium]|nr:TetR/AcrR family transcriptional regulator [Acidimicrobiales bacterium]